MAGRIEMPNSRSHGRGSRARYWADEQDAMRTGLVEKSDTGRRAQAAAGTGVFVLGAPRMKAVGPSIAAGREYAREAGDVKSFSRLDRAAGLRRQFLTGTTPFTPRFITKRPGLSALGGLALLAHSRRNRGARVTGP